MFILDKEDLERIRKGISYDEVSVKPSLRDRVVNDCHCPKCNNDRCDSREDTCWVCGEKLHT